MFSRLKALPIGLVLVVLLLAAATASAQTYTVTRTDDPIPGLCESGDCSLREALTASNNSTGVDDVVVLPASPVPYLIQYEELTLPINDDVEIRGDGADKTVVKGDGKAIVFTIGAVKATLAGLTITNGKGAIQSGADLTLRGLSIEGNERDADTGGVKSNGPLRLESSFVGFNRSNAATAGGVQANNPVTIVNSTVAHNTSKMGPGGIGGNSTIAIVSSAVVSNRSEAAEPAGAGAFTLSVRDSVFADNRNSAGLLNCASTNALITLGGNVSDDASCGTTATDKPNVNPLLGTLALHGGTTQVYDLLAGSPAIDAASQCPALDQRGVARPQGAACDSGPYELVPTPVLAPPADTEVAIRLGKGKLILSRRGFVRVKLTCLATEVSPPCSGQVKLLRPRPHAPRGLIVSGPGPLASKSFRIAAGETKKLALHLRRESADAIRSNPKKRVVGIEVRAQDAARNYKSLFSPRRIVPASSGSKRG